MTIFAGRNVKLTKNSFAKSIERSQGTGKVLAERVQQQIDFGLVFYMDSAKRNKGKGNALYLSLCYTSALQTHALNADKVLGSIKSIANVEVAKNSLGETILKMEANAETSTVNEAAGLVLWHNWKDDSTPVSKPKSLDKIAEVAIKACKKNGHDLADLIALLEVQQDMNLLAAESQASEKVEAELEEATAIPTIMSGLDMVDAGVVTPVSRAAA